MNKFAIKINNPAGMIFSLVIFLCILSVPVLFIFGSIALGIKILPYLYKITTGLIVGNIIVLLMAIVNKKMKSGVSGLLILSSIVYGISGWFVGLVVTYNIWGGFAVLIGLLFLGVGVVPMALLATLFNGMWEQFGIMIFYVIITYLSKLAATIFRKQIYVNQNPYHSAEEIHEAEIIEEIKEIEDK